MLLKNYTHKKDPCGLGVVPKAPAQRQIAPISTFTHLNYVFWRLGTIWILASVWINEMHLKAPTEGIYLVIVHFTKHLIALFTR